MVTLGNSNDATYQGCTWSNMLTLQDPPLKNKNMHYICLRSAVELRAVELANKKLLSFMNFYCHKRAYFSQIANCIFYLLNPKIHSCIFQGFYFMKQGYNLLNSLFIMWSLARQYSVQINIFSMIIQKLIREAFKYKVGHVYYTKEASKELIQPTYSILDHNNKITYMHIFWGFFFTKLNRSVPGNNCHSSRWQFNHCQQFRYICSTYFFHKICMPVAQDIFLASFFTALQHFQ